MGHADAGPGRLAPQEAARLNTRAAVASMSVAAGLCLLKAVAFAYSGSVALLASLADSLLDFTASALTWGAIRYAAEPADAEHRYGHGKAEALAGLGQSVLVAVSASLVAREAVSHFLEPRAITHGGWVLAVMGVSIVATVGLILYQTRIMRETGSVAVAGDRAHYAADFASNIAVMIGVGLTAFGGWLWADPLFGLAVAAWLAWGAWGVARGAINQIMDRELPPEERARICELALSDIQVRSVHNLRTRAAGPLVHIQFHAEVEPSLTVVAAHEIVVEAQQRILKAYPGADVIIHADPEGEGPEHEPEHFQIDAETSQTP